MRLSSSSNTAATVVSCFPAAATEDHIARTSPGMRYGPRGGGDGSGSDGDGDCGGDGDVVDEEEEEEGAAVCQPLVLSIAVASARKSVT